MWTLVNLLHRLTCLHPDRPIYRKTANGTKVLECTRCFKQFPGAFHDAKIGSKFTPHYVTPAGSISRPTISYGELA